MAEMFDIVIIGAGSGGCNAAIRAADLGKKVALIEYRKSDGIGGACLNRGCIPTKALIRSAEVYSLAKKMKAFGVSSDHVSFDLKDILTKKDAVVKKLAFGLEYLLKLRKVAIKKGEGEGS